MLNHLAIVTPAVLRRSLGLSTLAKRPALGARTRKGTSALCRIQSVTHVRAKYLTTALALVAFHAAYRAPFEADASSARRRNKNGPTRLFSLVKRQRRENLEESVWWIGVGSPTQVSRG
jgi:hypothetical protein